MSLGLLGLVACMTPGALDSGMSQSEFIAADSSARRAEITRLNTETAELEEWRQARLLAGHPVYFEFQDTGYTVQCQRVPGSPSNGLAVYGGHNAPGMDRATHQALVVYAADAQCIPVQRSIPGDTTGALMPVVLINNATAQEDYWRTVSRSVIPGFTNGIGLQLTRELLGDSCGSSGCGPSFTVVGGTSYAGSSSTSNSRSDLDFDANIGAQPYMGCATCVPGD